MKLSHLIPTFGLASVLLLSACQQNCPSAVGTPACDVSPSPECAPCDVPAAPTNDTKDAADQPAKTEEKVVIPETNDVQEVLAFLKATKTYYIATVEGDQPRVRPFGTINWFDGKLYFQTGKKKNVAHQIDANGKVELCAFDGQRWLRLAGEVVADDRIEAQTSMLDAYPELKSMYQPGDGNTVVYYFKNASATFSSFTAPERVIQF